MVTSGKPRVRVVSLVLVVALLGLLANVAGAGRALGVGTPPAGARSAAAPAADRTLIKGMSLTKSIYDLDSVLDRELDLIKGTGSTWVRADFDWSVAEDQRGQYNWFYLDRLVAHTAARGLQVLAVVDNTPTWARPAGTNQHGAPLNPRAFARFAADAVERYYPYGVTHWEVWNEPNLAYFWRPKPDARRYANLLSATTDAIHAVAPDAVVLSGGLSPHADGSDPMKIEPHAFLQTVYQRGAMGEVDAIGMHPYTFPVGPTDPRSAFAQLWQLLFMAARPNQDRYVWITEFGAPTGDGPIGVSEQAQARILTEACTIARGQTWLGPVFLYQLQDEGNDPNNLGHHFGLLRYDGSAKPAYAAWRDC